MSYIETEQAGEVLIARLRLQRITADLAGPAFAEILGASESAKAVLVDLGQVDFLDSTGIGEMVQFGKKLRARGAAFSLAGLSPPLMQLVRMMRLERIMAFDPDRASALQRLQDGAQGTAKP
jgi:anti-anti-sigma factor